MNWMGANWAAPVEAINHRLSFSSLLGKGKVENNLNGLWICVIWILWKWRNSVIFQEAPSGILGESKLKLNADFRVGVWSTVRPIHASVFPVGRRVR